MNNAALNVESLHVRKMYGLQHNGLRVDDLSPGINVIHGPNASGKSTLAQALQGTCWPELVRGARAEIVGHFQYDGSQWRASIDAGHVLYQRDGVEEARPSLAPAEQHDRYLLALHDLLDATNERFAKAILEAAAGGYSVETAREQLGFVSTNPRFNDPSKRAKEAFEALREAQQREEDVWAYRRKIEILEDELEAARSAKRKIDALEQAKVVVAKRRDLHEAEQAVEGFSDAVGQLDGKEEDRLKQYRTDREEAEATIDEAQKAIDEANASLETNRIPEEGLSDGFIAGCSSKVDALEKAEMQVERIEEKRVGAVEKRQEEWSQIDGALDDDKVDAIDLDAVGDVAAWAKETETMRARQKAISELKRVLEDGERALEGEGAVKEPGDIKEGIRLLRRWLGAAAHDGDGRTSGTTRTLILVGIVLTVAASVASGIYISPLGWALLLVAALLIGAYVVASRNNVAEGDRPVYQKDFERLDLPSPRQWTVKGIQSHISQLEEQYDSARMRSMKRSVWKQHSAKQSQIDEDVAQLEKEREAIAGAIGIAPQFDDNPLEEASIYYLVQSIRRWQDAANEVKGYEQELEAARQHRDERLAAINEELKPFGYDPAQGSSEARGLVEALRDEHTAYTEAKQERRHAQNNLEEAEKRKAAADGDIKVLFESLGLDKDDEAGLSRLLEQRETYSEAVEDMRTTRVELRTERERLNDHPAYEEGMEERESEGLDAEIERLTRKASDIDDLQEEITRKQERIDQAMDQHDVEEAQARHDRAVKELEEEHTADARAVAGWCLANYVHEKTRDQELPEVFHTARELFLKITQGRYRLEFNHKDASFAAYDTRKERGMPLEELSSGTRVQLLLAVRVAFVKVQEQGVTLPLILDETLANSDDEKAEAIIKAVQEISAEGRQVFYFTAQDDEVTKWRALENGGGVEHRFIPVDGSTADAPRTDEEVTAPSRPSQDDLPEPQGHTHATYGDALSVPLWTPREPLGALHLWYVVDDVAALYQVLKTGIRSWGPFHELVETSSVDYLDLEHRHMAKARACANAVRAWKEAWLTGRGRRVDRAALEAADAVSETFIDRVAALSEKEDGEAEAIIKGLRRGDVKRFQENKADELEIYFEQHGYIDPTPTLSEEEIRSRILAASSDALSNGVVTSDELWAVLERIERVRTSNHD